MATLRDEEEQKGSGLNQALGQQPSAQQAQPQEQQAPMEGAGQSQISASQGAKAPQAPAQKQQKAGTGTFANLKSYLQAAQGGGRVSQAATQRVQNVASQAQKGIQQAQKAFGTKMEAGSLQGMGTAAEEAKGIIGTARGVTYQAPKQPAAQAPQTTAQAVEVEQPVPPAQPQAPVQSQQYFTPKQQQRFAEIINAQYQGPESLQQAGLYEQAARKAQIAQQALQQSQTAGGREQLLRDIFGRNRDYSRGQSKLDALLLNTSQQGIQSLQEQAQKAGNVQQQLQEAQNLSANEAARRAEAIQGIASGARTAFTTARTAEEEATNKRITDLVETPAVDATGNKIPKTDSKGDPILDSAGNIVYQTEWDRLPEYFRNIIRSKESTNKAIQTERISKLESSSGLNESGYNAALKKVADQEKALQQANMANISRSIAGLPADENADERIKVAQSNLDASKKALAGYSDFVNELKNIKNMNMNQLNLSPEEMAILGVSSGEGLYNLGENLIGNVAAERERLITKDELSRQLALQQLAGLDTSNQLQKDLLYKDLEKAGTQTLGSSLNVEGIREALKGAQEGFKSSAEGATLTGTGSKKVSRGNAFGKKTKTYTAEESGNVAEMLRQGGYDVSKMEPEQVKSLLTNRDLLNRYLGATSTSRDTESNIGGSTLEGASAGATTGASIGSLFGGVGAAPGAAIGTAIGAAIGANTLDPIQATTDFYKELEEKLGIKGLGAVGQGVQDVRSGVGGVFTGAGNIAGSSVIGDVFRGIGGIVGGINTGEMKKVGESTAKQIAIRDLERKYKQYLQGQGFENRLVASQDPEVLARSAALQNLLRRQG